MGTISAWGIVIMFVEVLLFEKLTAGNDESRITILEAMTFPVNPGIFLKARIGIAEKSNEEFS